MATKIDKELQLKNEEALSEWVERLADAMELTPKQRATMHEVCKQSYFKGMDAAFNASGENLLHYTIELADNGIILRDPNCPWTEVVQYGGENNSDSLPAAFALGKMLYEDIEEVEKQFDEDVEYFGYDLTISVKPLTK